MKHIKTVIYSKSLITMIAIIQKLYDYAITQYLLNIIILYIDVNVP